MSLCFLTGSNNAQLVVRDALEFIEFNAADEVCVTCDFFVENQTEDDATLYVVHRGQLDLVDSTSDWLDGVESETSVAQRVLTSRFHTFKVEPNGDEGEARVVRAPQGRDEIYKVHRQKKFQQTNPGGEASRCKSAGTVPFSSAEFFLPIKHGKRQLVRVRGLITHESLRAFATTPDKIQILGEGKLLAAIRRSIGVIGRANDQKTAAAEFEKFIDDFEEHRWNLANDYHFVLETSHMDRLGSPRAITADLNAKLKDVEVGDRRITWFCSSATGFLESERREVGPIITARVEGLMPFVDLGTDDMNLSALLRHAMKCVPALAGPELLASLPVGRALKAAAQGA